MSERKASYGLWMLCAKMATKFGGKALPAFLKLFKFSKVSWAVSLGTYAVIFNWKFAAMIIASLFVHEYGHVWAMRREGMKVRGMYFIPFLGAAAVAKDQFPSRAAEVRIALMGPLWGGILAAATYGVYMLTREPIIAAVAGWMAMVNLFNLLPVMPLDGGRVMRCVATSFSSWFGVGLFLLTSIAAFSISIAFDMTLILFVFAIGLFESVTDTLKGIGNRRREQAAEDLAELCGTDKSPKAVAKAIETILKQNLEWHASYCNTEDGYAAGRGLDDYTMLRHEPIRSAVFEGWSDFLNSSDREGFSVGMLMRPLDDLFVGRMRDPLWLKRLAYYDRATLLDKLISDLRKYDDTTTAMKPLQLTGATLGFVGIAVCLVALLLATRHVPGADAAFAVFMD